MKNELTENEIQELEKQLECPSGNKGIEVGKTLNETNIGMTLKTIEFLKIKNENYVLELGHGNCGHLNKLLDQAKNIHFFGLEISETMCNEAIKLNQEIMTNGNTEFSLYNGEKIPFEDNFFDRILIVNTIYFWSNPTLLIKEIQRILKPGGHCILTFANKKFMEKLLFVRKRFMLYGKEEIKKLVSHSSLQIEEYKEICEQVISKTGEQVNREFSMVKLNKSYN